MKKYILILLSAVAVSCNNTATTSDAGTANAPAAEKPKHKASDKVDPVCDMPYDTAWTNKTVYQNDTIHFCSDNCEKAFKLKPTKYVQGS
jgi:YHS domain-containing protein